MFCVDVWNTCLTTPGSFISAIRYSGSPAEGSTNKENSGLETGRVIIRELKRKMMGMAQRVNQQQKLYI